MMNAWNRFLKRHPSNIEGFSPSPGSWTNCETHRGRMTHVFVSKLGHHWFRQWLVAWSAPSHYMNQCWGIVNWTLGNKLQWNFNQNIKLFIHENVSENIVCEMAAILFRWRWVNWAIGGNKFQRNLYRNSTISFKKTHLKVLSAKWRPFRLVFNVLPPVRRVGKYCNVLLMDMWLGLYLSGLHIGYWYH